MISRAGVPQQILLIINGMRNQLNTWECVKELRIKGSHNSNQRQLLRMVSLAWFMWTMISEDFHLRDGTLWEHETFKKSSRQRD